MLHFVSLYLPVSVAGPLLGRRTLFAIQPHHQLTRRDVVILSLLQELEVGESTAKYVAMCEAGKGTVWLESLLIELGFRLTAPVTLYADNQGSITWANNPNFHRRTKNIDVQHRWIREALLMRQIEIAYVPTKEMPADGLTKALPAPAFRKFCRMIGMRIRDPNP